MHYFMGIDGGGSNLRVLIVDADMNQLALVRGATANPSIIGFDALKILLEKTIAEALADAKLNRMDALAIGIAGAPASRSAAWLRKTIANILPETQIVVSSDDEIALVGALGERQGILILAGTGSIGYGRNAAGESLRVGGWGYILGDGGSGYCLGSQALQLLAQADDNPFGEQSAIIAKLRQEPHFANRNSIIAWLYSERETVVARVATLAEVVLEAAAEGDSEALSMIEEGAAFLENWVELLKRRLKMPTARIAFAGSLLSHDTLLCRKLMADLEILERPVAQYEPVFGAALLAKLDFEKDI
jgi:N-acetylglucosamine kinase-like BadF-type ATPase